MTTAVVVIGLALLGRPVAWSQDSGSRVKQEQGHRVRVGEPDQPLVKMAIDPVRPAVGDTVSITLRIVAGEDVGHVPFHVTFDPAVLQFQEGEELGFLKKDGKETAFFAAATSSADTVVVGLSRLGRIEGVEGDGELCVLRFTALNPGDAKLGFASAKVRDSTNRIVKSSFVPSRLVVR
jgi:hypothetical protein